MPTYSGNILPRSGDYVTDGIIKISAEERMKSIVSWEKAEEEVIYLQFPRGNCLRDGDYIEVRELSLVLEIVPKPELVLHITATDHQTLMRVAYHLGNRHVPLEISSSWLRLHPDAVIEALLAEMGVTITTETVPFYPETGAYHRH